MKNKWMIGFLAFSCSTYGQDTYNGFIERLQTEEVGSPYNTLYLAQDVTESPCVSSNQSNRFAISNEMQYSAALSALMANKEVLIGTTGDCNAASIETINLIMLYREK